MSVRAREDRDWDTESYRGRREPRSFTTVRRYRIPDRDKQDDRFETESFVSRREAQPRENVRTFRYERDVERERPERQRSFQDDRNYASRRQVSRSPSPEDERVIRIKREIEREGPERADELERYSRTVDYYGRSEQPQPIIIRQEAQRPIIIREPAPEPVVIQEEKMPEPKVEVLERSDQRSEIHSERRPETREDRQLARREPSPEEDYYYQRTTRQVARRKEPTPEPEPEPDYDERDYRRPPEREVGPRDSASQYGDDRNSDDEYYYRRTEEWEEEGRDSSPHHRRHLAEGAVVGLGAAALLRNHKKNQGEKTGGAGTLVGGAALGALGAEAITRARSHYGRSQSRERGGRRRHRRNEDDERSDPQSGPSNLAKVAGVAILGAAAGYAYNRVKKNRAEKGDDDRRSRSRRRKSSRGHDRSSSGSDDAREVNKDPDAKDRNSVIAKAGLASAAVAGLVDRVRSQSRGNKPKTRVRTGVPIVAAGLGGAAIAGLYENNKAKKVEKEAERKRSVSRGKNRHRSRDRSYSRSRPEPYFDGRRDVPGDNDQNLIEYGGDPIPPDEYYQRPRSRADSYYSEPGGFTERRRESPDLVESPSRHRRHRSPDRAAATDAAVGAGVAGVAAHEASQRRERKRAERKHRRQTEEIGETPTSGYGFGPYAQEPPPQNIPPPPSQYPPAGQYYPQTVNFPPPPNIYSPTPNNPIQPPYNSTYGAEHGYTPPLGALPGEEPYGYPSQQGPYPRDQRYHPGNNVSAPSATPEHSEYTADIETVRNVSPSPPPGQRRKSVQFDSTPSVHVLPEYEVQDKGDSSDDMNKDNANDSNAAPEYHKAKRKKRRHNREGDNEPSSHHHRHHRKHSERAISPTSDDLGHTTTQFEDGSEEQGHKKGERGEDAVADKLEDILNGRGTMGKLFQKVTGDLVGASSAKR